MKKYLKGIILPLALLILLIFIIFVINQTVQVVSLAERIHPTLGLIALWGLLAIYLILLVVPVILYVRMPAALEPPESEQSPEFEEYLARLSRRLQKNSNLQGMSLNSRDEIEAALNHLNTAATELIKRNAATVFVTTAISQSGRLDAFTVLIAQIRMIWQIARLYNQRPSLREMIRLYANVAATSMVASELGDIDISQQVEPIVTSVVGASVTSAIPGVHTVANIITNSLLNGSANALLTLRVGAIARQYCGSLLKKERGFIRRSASLEAAKMLSAIVMSSAGNITRAVVNAAVKSPGKFSRDLVSSTWNKLFGREKGPPEFTDPMPSDE